MLSSMQSSSIIWITGGGSGIGKAAAVAMARPGTQIALSGRRPAELEAAVAAVNAAGGHAEAHPLDVSDTAAVVRVAQSILSRHGRVDTLINSAGTNVPKRAWNSISTSDFRRVVDVNLNGAFNCISTVLPSMRANRQGTIINVSSWAGFYLTKLTGPAYSASKRAMIAMTESLNMEECHNGIRACVISPGEVATEILKTRPARPSQEDMDRMLQAEDLASTIKFVCDLPPTAAIHQVVIAPTWNRMYLGFKELGI
jgi:NAD(P)-dependent dehydrogenase (short-subunit alcohol dehydrogenase family)